MKNMEPWWVAGAEVNELLEAVALMSSAAQVGVNHDSVDDTDRFCLREQIYFDGLGVGINIDVKAKFTHFLHNSCLAKKRTIR